MEVKNRCKYLDWSGIIPAMPDWIRRIMDNWVALSVIFAVPILAALLGLFSDEIKGALEANYTVRGLFIALLLYLIWIPSAAAFSIWIKGRERQRDLAENLSKIEKKQTESIKAFSDTISHVTSTSKQESLIADNSLSASELFELAATENPYREDEILGIKWRWFSVNPEKTLEPHCPKCGRELQIKHQSRRDLIRRPTNPCTVHDCIQCGQIKSGPDSSSEFLKKVLIEVRHRTEQGKYEKDTKPSNI